MRQASSGFDIIQAFPAGGTTHAISASTANSVTTLTNADLEVFTILNANHATFVRFGKNNTVDADNTAPFDETLVLAANERFTGAVPYKSTHVSIKTLNGSGTVYFTEGGRYFQ
jgi:hypothetical protein